MEQFEKIKEILEGLNEDVEKFYGKKNGTAGTRVRQGLQEIRKISQEMRLEISAIKKADKEAKEAAKNA
jgi:hypothetical protein